MKKIFGDNPQSTITGLLLAAILVVQDMMQEGETNWVKIGLAVATAILGRLVAGEKPEPVKANVYGMAATVDKKPDWKIDASRVLTFLSYFVVAALAYRFSPFYLQPTFANAIFPALIVYVYIFLSGYWFFKGNEYGNFVNNPSAANAKQHKVKNQIVLTLVAGTIINLVAFFV